MSLPKTLSPETKKLITDYRAYLGIDIEILEETATAKTVEISQNRLINGYILNREQLVTRVKDVFKDTEVEIKVIPKVYCFNEESITITWFSKKIEEFKINTNDLIKQLGVNTEIYTSYVNGKIAMPKSFKATLFYYFLCLQLNKDFREYLN